MRKIQNVNISFRATEDLKQRLTEFCHENDLHNSNVIRQALNSYLRQEKKTKMPALWRTDNTSNMQPQQDETLLERRLG
jgi:hypothetical protein